MPRFRVQLIGNDGDVVEERDVRAATRDEAAADVAGERLHRYARGPQNALRIKVYHELPGGTTLIRYYSKQPASVSRGLADG